MSSLLAAPAADARVESRPVTLRQVVDSERIKFLTLRSTVLVLLAALLGMLIVAMIVGYNTRHLSATLDPNDIVPSAPLQGYYLGQLLIGALGVLFVTGEYSTGMIRSTLVAVPQRVPVLWGKLIVFVCATLIPLVAVSVVAFLSAEGLISHFRRGFSLSDPGAARVVLGTGVYLTLIGLIGMAIGWIVRSTPGALVTYLGTILVIPVIFADVLGHWGQQVAKFLPSQAGSAFINTIPDGPSLHPWAGLGVMALWVVGFLVVAVITLRRRDG
jgi:hypothetical protein